MKKIGLFLGSEPSCGGMFQYNQVMLDAVSALPADRYSIVVAYTSAEWLAYLKGTPYPSVYVPKGFWGRALWRVWSMMGLPVGAWRTMTPFFHPLAKALLREHCDLWVFPTQNSYCFQMPVPALAAIHDLMHRYESHFPEVSARGMYDSRDRTDRNMCRWSLGILVDSEVGKQHVMESYGLAAERIHVLPYVPPKYLFAQGKQEDFDARYALPEKFLFYPAQFWEHKNHKRLIGAVSRLRQEIPEVKLVLVGSAKNGHASAMQQIRDLSLEENVIVKGYVPDADMPEFYRRARALIMPTFFGPTNIPPLEAFVAGCPVAISRIYGMPDQVGNAALLFDPNSVDEIAACMRRLWLDDELCAELIKNGRQRAAAWGQMQFNKRMSEIIETVLPS